MKRTPKAPYAPSERMKRADRAIRALYDPILQEPVPQRLRALVRRRLRSSHAGDEDGRGKTVPPRRRNGD